MTTPFSTMKSTRLPIVLLTLVLAALHGCATQSDAPATQDDPVTQNPAAKPRQEGWAFDEPVSTAAPTEVAANDEASSSNQLPPSEKADAPLSVQLSSTTKADIPSSALLPPSEKADAPSSVQLSSTTKADIPSSVQLSSTTKADAPSSVQLPPSVRGDAPEGQGGVLAAPAVASAKPVAEAVPSAQSNVVEDSPEVSEPSSADSSPVTRHSSLPESAAPAPIPWRTPTYSLVARSMDLRQALETFGSAQGVATLLSPAVVGVLSGEFDDIPCDEFLDRLAALHNLSWYWDGATLFVYGSGETQTMLLDLRYMKAGEVRDMLAELGVEDPRFPLKTASNDELIMVSGPPRYVSLVAEMIQKADALREKRTFTEVETRIFPLENTWAADVSFNASSPESSGSIKGVATMLQQIVGKIANPETREAGSTNAPAAFQPLITAENRLNAVIVTDVATRMPLYERLIRELDVPQKLLEIQVTVVEMSRKDALDWQLSIAATGARDRISGGAGQNAGNLFASEDLAGRGLAGALTYLGSQATVSASLTALRDKGKARNISRTSLLTVNNLAAELSDTQSYHARVVGAEVAELATVSAGTTLQVKPRIMRQATPDGLARIWLTLSLQDGGFETVSVDSMPMTRTTSLDTQTSIYEEDTIILAGYLRDIEESAGWGIPLLRDIPFIGWLFGGHSSKTETVQRLFLISPRILDTDIEDIARLQATRLRDITDMETLEDDADEDADERRIRDLDRQARRERREEYLDEQLKRRKLDLQRARAERERRRAERDAEWEEANNRRGCLPW